MYGLGWDGVNIYFLSVFSCKIAGGGGGGNHKSQETMMAMAVIFHMVI